VVRLDPDLVLNVDVTEFVCLFLLGLGVPLCIIDGAVSVRAFVLGLGVAFRFVRLARVDGEIDVVFVLVVLVDGGGGNDIVLNGGGGNRIVDAVTVLLFVVVLVVVITVGVVFDAVGGVVCCARRLSFCNIRVKFCFLSVRNISLRLSLLPMVSILAHSGTAFVIATNSLL